MKQLIFASLIITAFGAQADTCDLQALQQPLQLMAQRAQIMKQVAATKWYNTPNHQAAAYGAIQEVKVLQNAEILADQMGVDPWRLLVFVQVQMDLSKQIEAYWINYWNLPSTPANQKPTVKTVISLDQLRDQIKQIDGRLYPAINRALPAIDDCSISKMHVVYQQNFGNIAGIPLHPNYGKVYLQALKGING